MILRSYQEECINCIYHYFAQSTGNPLACLPTATGKSLIIAEFIRRMFYHFRNQRVMALVHVKELIEQNYKTLMTIWPDAPAGIYSAGLDQRDIFQPIIFAGIASVYKKAELFGHRDLLFIDEAHLLSPDNDTMYQQFINAMKAINPYLKVVGLTATWYRMKHGTLTESGLFSDVCFNICDVEGFARLIHEGFLSPPIPKRTRTKLDVSGVDVMAGEFVQSQLQKAVDKQAVTEAAIKEMCEQGHDRKSWLVFCSGIDHADHCADVLNACGVEAASVHSKVSNGERDSRIAAFKAGELRAITNNNVLTTGFDHPPIDLIGMLRPTMSPGLWVQMVGRGTRIAEGKTNCLVLDFAANTMRLGPIDDPQIPTKKGKGTGEVPVKICEACGCYNHTRAKFCIGCGAEFTFQEKLVRHASTDELITSSQMQVETFDIHRVMYNRHVGKASGRASIKVSYICGLQRFNEFVTFDHAGFALHRAHEWWRQRHATPPPLSTDLALRQIMECRTPRRVRVWVNREKFPQVLSVEW